MQSTKDERKMQRTLLSMIPPPRCKRYYKFHSAFDIYQAKKG